MRILIWNVNGLGPTHRNIVLQHSSLAQFFSYYQADVICFQETKLQQEKLSDDLTSVKGFESFWACSKSRKGYSGVCTWVSRKFSPIQAEVDCLGDGLNDFDDEGRIVLVDLESFVLLNVYVPNAGDPPTRPRLSTKLHFLEKLRIKIEELREQGKEVLIVGDFNIASTNNDVHASFKLDEIYCKEEIDSFRKLLIEQVDIWRYLHPEETNTFTVFNEKKGYREFNKGLRIDYALCTHGLISSVASCEVLSTPRKWSDHTALLLELENIQEVKSHRPCTLSSLVLFKKQQTLLSMFSTVEPSQSVEEQ